MFNPIKWAKMHFKKFNQSIDEMSNDDKQLYLDKLLRNADTIGIDDKIFQIIDSFEESYRKYLVLNIKFYALYYIKNDKLRNEFYKKFFIKYYSKDEILDMIMVNYIDYRCIYADLFEFILDKLTYIEIEAFLSVSYFLDDAQIDRIKECILLKSSYPINSHNVSKFIDYSEGKEHLLSLINRLDKKERASIIKNKMRYQILDEGFRLEVFEILEEYEKIYLILHFNFKYNYDKLSFEEFKKLFILLYENKELYILRNYLELYSLDELNDLRKYLSSIGYADESLFIIDNEINFKKNYIDFDYFESLNNDEKVSYLLNSDIDIFYNVIFSKYLHLINKEELKKKIFGKEFSSLEVLGSTVFTIDEICKLILDDHIIVNVYCLKYLVEVCTLEQMQSIINKIIFSKCVVSNLLSEIYCLDTSPDMKKIVFEKFNELSDFDSYCTDFDEVKFFANNYPNILKNIDYNFHLLSVDELINLPDIYISNFIYARTLFHIYFNECLDKEKLVDKKFKILKEYGCNSELIDNVRSDQLSFLLLDKVFNNLDEDLKLDLLSKENIFTMLNDQNKYLDFVDKLKNGKEILELYSYINEDNYDKLSIEKKESVSSAQYYFRINIKTVATHLGEIKRLVSINPYVLFTLKYDLLRVFEGKELDYFSRFDISFRNFKEDKIELIKNALKKLKSKVDYPEKYIHYLLRIVSSTDMDLSDVNVDKLIYYINKKPKIFDALGDPKYVLDNIVKSEEKNLEKIINNPNSSLDELRDIVLRKCFYMNLDEAKKIIREYGSSVDELICKYDLNTSSIKAREELLILNSLKIIDSVLKLEDVELLRQCYKEIDSNFEFYYLDNLVLEDVIKTIYTRELICNLTILEDREKTNVVKYHNREIPVYELKDNFCMLVSVIGAYVKNSDALKNPYADWNGDTKTANHGICTSLIANDNLSFANIECKDPLIYGFYNIEVSAVEKSANYDLGSNSNSVEIVSTFESCFMTSRSMIDNTRQGHNEFVLERRSLSSDERVIRRMPDYVIALNNITDLHNKAASQFGIPIVVLNVNDIALNESNKLDNTMVQIRRNINSSLLSEFVVKYFNNYAGLVGNFNKCCKMYFNPIKYKNYFKEIIEIINRVYDPVKKYEIANCYLNLLKNEYSKMISVYKKFRPFELNNLISEVEELIKTIKLPEVSIISKKVDNVDIDEDMFINSNELEEKETIGMKR